ncbi:hypothetical protein Q0601_03260 [Paracoccus onubensis]|uniref:hypothetical protein n=1 Tax=Paracoccus onubensis TaxID=1675788 RepID=UPI00272F4DA1|nr:hypothetical protein [Paracoccus onubensis]MDP0926182.1 hypothetical protein [Paracoccus onubensis]
MLRDFVTSQVTARPPDTPRARPAPYIALVKAIAEITDAMFDFPASLRNPACLKNIAEFMPSLKRVKLERSDQGI